jgi:hypothetical protein
MLKPNILKNNYCRVILFLLLSLSLNFLFAQGDPLNDETSIFVESDLYMDAYTNVNKRQIFNDQTTLPGGYLGLGLGSNAPAAPDPRRVNTLCNPPSPECVNWDDVNCVCLDSAPIDSEILYLIFAGLIYGIYKSRRKLAI